MSKLHSVQLNEEKCVGCTNCIKRCPTQAIRVRDGKARIDELRCIDCGECIKACPHHAKSAVMDHLEELSKYRYTIALAAPSLYAQFGTPATRCMVLAALRNIGFDDVYEVALGAEIVTQGTREYMDIARNDKRLPLISSACPAVVRVIQEKYPGLIENLVPFDAPMEVSAAIARKETIEKTKFKSSEIGIFFISPCPAKRTAVTNPIGGRHSEIDGVISFAEAYPQILATLENMNADDICEFEKRIVADSYGVRWGGSGGEAVGLQIEKYLAVDGILNVVGILEEIENERLRDIDFIEANSCMGGCIGGPLTVANRYSAKSRLNRYVREAEAYEQMHPDAVFKAITCDMNVWDHLPEPNRALQLDPNILKALEKYEQMEKIAHDLPGLDCGACGAPDCSALAEDIVRGFATETDCIFKLKERIRNVVAQMSDLEIELNRHSKGGGNHEQT
ncbi:MAG: [Fe-Fe] hydrogenase large subunit C-terminal domain-containing protein [Eubacteriales bacterium]|nr:[Fe-Fe] hydrogenase large subunit C-terminal domain-containing protein [Eubacteriales bacterium]